MDIIEFKREMIAEGRNGIMRQIGIEISLVDDHINIFPVNTKGTGRCLIQIPLEQAGDVSKFLDTIKFDNIEKALKLKQQNEEAI